MSPFLFEIVLFVMTLILNINMFCLLYRHDFPLYSNLAGFFYPVQESVRAIEEDNKQQQTQW